MKKKSVLFNEYNKLTLFRERSIHSIESSINTYITFLGFLLTALSILLSTETIKEIQDNLLLISTILGLVFSLYGVRTFRLMYISHENLVIYTRQLNITRNNLIGGRDKLEKMVLLPKSWQHVEFDRFGHEKIVFSKKGSSGTVKIINSAIISFVLLSLYILLFSKELPIGCNILIFIISFITSIFYHNRWIESAIKSSKKRWNELMDSDKYPEFFEE